jgi:hypothetical protein
MSYEATQYCIELNDSGVTDAGTFTLSEATEIQYLNVGIVIYNKTITTEQIRAVFYADADQNVTVATSDWYDLGDIADIATDWNGYCRLSFNREILAATSFYLALETNNYTSGASAWIGAKLDYPDPYNTQAITTQFAVDAIIVGYK